MGADDAGRVAWRWLREFFLGDWSLKLLALLITFVLWFAVTSQRAPATLHVRGVELEYVRAEGVEISNDPLDEVAVTLEGGRGKLDELNARNLVARVDITQLRPGERVLQLTEKSVLMELPEGVRIVRVEPRSVALRLERVVERELDVEPRLDGKPAEGFEVRGVTVTPPRVLVRGPESRVGAVARAFTETIPVEGQRETLNSPQVAVDIADRKVVPVDPLVAVRVEIVPTQGERRIAGVRVASAQGAEARPATALVVVRGPRALVDALRAEQLSVVVEQAEDGTRRSRVTLPPELAGRVEVVGVEPAEFNVTER
jgi:YbbR domain-containing protein